MDGHLNKSLLKSKRIAESPLLPNQVRDIIKPVGDEEHILAYNNVTARMYNTKAVKDVISQIMTIMYIALEIPEPSAPAKGKKGKVDAKGAGRDVKNENTSAKVVKIKPDESEGYTQNSAEEGLSKTVTALVQTMEEGSWSGFGSEDEKENQDDDDDDDNDNSDGSNASGDDASDNGDDFSLDEDQLSRYENLLGNSDSESDSDPGRPLSRESSFPPIPPPKKIREDAPKPDLPTPKGSVFLPTLMGGYYSGTDSNPSDIEDIDDPHGPAPPRKNRRGQRERRKIAELKFGARAKHIAAANKNPKDRREEDWDMKEGARTSTDDGRGPPNRKQRRIAGARETRVNTKMTGENAIPLGDGERERKSEKKGRDGDAAKKGVNHPSWQAAKKVKEASKKATFQGTKVKF